MYSLLHLFQDCCTIRWTNFHLVNFNLDTFGISPSSAVKVIAAMIRKCFNVKPFELKLNGQSGSKFEQASASTKIVANFSKLKFLYHSVKYVEHN